MAHERGTFAMSILTTVDTPSIEASSARLERLLLLALCGLLALLATAQEHVQTHQDRTRKVEITGNQAITSCIELMPDGHTLVIGTTQDHPLYVMDTIGWKVVRTMDVDGYYAGPDVQASAKGNLLLLRQKFYLDFRANQDREVRHEVVDFANGRTLVEIDKAHDAAISPDESKLYSLEGEDVTVRSLPDGKVIGRIEVPQSRNSLALSPDGKMLAVAHRPTPEQLESVPSMRGDKKAVKPAMKYRQMITVYDTRTGKAMGTVPEIYDHIYDMRCTNSGDRLLVYAIAHTKLNGAANALPQGVVNQIELPTLKPIRTGFLSLMKEPQIEPNAQGDRLALASTDGSINGRKLHVYDMATGEFTLDLDMDTRWRLNMKEKEYHDGNVPYHFLADGRTIAIGSGAWLRLVTTP